MTITRVIKSTGFLNSGINIKKTREKKRPIHELLVKVIERHDSDKIRLTKRKRACPHFFFFALRKNNTSIIGIIVIRKADAKLA
jgi:hypothetical protein